MTHTDPRIPKAEACVFRDLVDFRARTMPERLFARFNNGEPDWTYADLRRKVLQTANALRKLGVRQGDHVIGWLESGPLPIRVWLAVNYLGAVYIPINLAYKGGLLQHALQLSDARVLVCEAGLLPRLAEIDCGPVKTLFAVGSAAASVPGIEVVAGDVLLEGSETDVPPVERAIEPWDTQAILYTSGTTGPSKAVLNSYVQIYNTSLGAYPGMQERDRALIHSPFFHITALSQIGWALVTGGSIGILERYNTATFWADVRRVGGTFMVMMGAHCAFLSKLERTADEIETPLRFASLIPLNSETIAFCKRIGAHYASGFNMTETSVPLQTELDTAALGSCGRPRGSNEARVVDENDCEVPTGTVGELILRSDTPWVLSSGYYKNPEATAQAWRNGWFHTGDACRVDEDGNFYYVDRMKDAIRRRGENISSFEVEVEIQTHPQVVECAAIAVPSEYDEDEVMVVVSPRAGTTLDPAELIRFAIARMPHYMVPRFVRLMDELPKTPSMKVQKAVLRKDGITSDTWDREKAGIKVKRETV